MNIFYTKSNRQGLTNRYSVFFLLAVALFAVGCASTGKSTSRQPFTTKLGTYKSAQIDVSSSIQKPTDKSKEFVTQLEVRVIAKLRERKSFEKIYSKAADGSATAELGVKIVVTGVRDVDSFDRVMFGAFAGQANTKATLEIREISTNRLLGSSDIIGKSSGGSVVAGTTSEAVDRVADEIVRVISENL